MIKLAALLFIPALLTAVSCSKSSTAKDAIAGAKEIGVIVAQDSSVRIHPLIYSARVFVLSTGDQVEVLDKSKEKAPVGGKLTYWYKIRLKSGIIGWVYGANIKVFAEGSDSSVESFAKQLRSAESVRMMKSLKGKWWSVTDKDSFSNDILSLKDDGTYASMLKGNDKPTEGTYTVDTVNEEISFDKGSTVGAKISYIMRGAMFILEATNNGKKVQFKKISNDPDFKKDMVDPDESTEAPAAGNTPAKEKK